MLQQHENEEIYKLAYDMVDTYFGSVSVSICPHALRWSTVLQCYLLVLIAAMA